MMFLTQLTLNLMKQVKCISLNTLQICLGYQMQFHQWKIKNDSFEIDYYLIDIEYKNDFYQINN